MDSSVYHSLVFAGDTNALTSRTGAGYKQLLRLLLNNCSKTQTEGQHIGSQQAGKKLSVAQCPSHHYQHF